jgi:hypothetical protein
MATSISDIIAQNTVGQSEGLPVGVPTYYDWYNGKNSGASAPPSDFTSVTAWGQVYQQAGQPANTNPNANVEIANARTYVHLKATGEWVLVQDQATSGIDGGHFVNDFAGNQAIDMRVSNLSGGTVGLAPPPSGYNDHFWQTSRGAYSAGSVDGVYVQMDMRVSDPSLHLVANIGADWWRSPTAPFVDGMANNPGAGMNNWTVLSTEWSTLGYYSTSTAQFQADPPPSLLGSATTTPPPVGSTPDTAAPSAPTIAAFTPDTGTVGDKITTASVLTLSGTSEAGSTVKLFDGTTQIGTAKANASGAWSLATAELSTGTHNFTARATDVAGNSSAASASLSLRVDALSSPPVSGTNPPASGTNPSQPASGANLLVNGSLEATSLAANHWEGFSSIPGWTALAGGTIELWNNLNNVQATNGSNFGELDWLGARDGLYQSVKTVAGQSYDLSFDARSRPGLSASTTSMEVLWNDSVIATVPPGNSWDSYHFTVAGTGGQDKLTLREVASQSADGHGALYDNISLVPVGSASTTRQSAIQSPSVTQSPTVESAPATSSMTQSSDSSLPMTTFGSAWGRTGSSFGAASGPTADSTRAMNLMTQYSASSFPATTFGAIGGLTQTAASAALAQTLGAAKS